MTESTSVSVISSSCSSEDSDAEAEASRSSNVSPVSLLSRLKSPKPSDLCRKRKVASNVSKRKRKSRGSTSAEPKHIQPHQRLRHFPSEPLTIAKNKKLLFCEACREELSLNKGVLSNHMKSSKHIEGKRKLESNEAREKNIAEALRKHNEESHLVGETLPDSQQVYRVKVVTAFLQSGVPLSKVEYFRDILELYGYRLTDRRHLSDLIPFIRAQEESTIRKALNHTPISVIFDGTTNLGKY